MGVIAQRAPESEESTIGRDSTTRTLFYNINAINQLDAEYSLWSQSPAVYQGLYKQDFKATAKLPGQFWEGEVNYAWPKKNQEVGTCWVEWDTTGGRQKITNSIKTRYSYFSPSSTLTVPPSFNTAIGVGQDGAVAGVEIVVPSLKFAVHAILDFSVITMAQIQSWAAQTGTMNVAPMFGGAFDMYEVLFLGCTGTSQQMSISQPGVEVIFQFEAAQNAASLTVGDITGIAKEGFDYLWVLFAKSVDSGSKMLAPRPIAAYCEQVYQTSDLNQLGIPDPDNNGQPYSGPQYSE